MPRKLKLDPVDVELSPEEFTRRLKAVGRGDYYFDWLKAAFEDPRTSVRFIHRKK